MVEIHASNRVSIGAPRAKAGTVSGCNAAHAYAAMHVLPVLFRGACQLLEEHAQRGFKHLFAGGVANKRQEFVTAISADNVILPVDVPKLGCDLADPEIADCVSRMCR